jgi:hypothetical protein
VGCNEEIKPAWSLVGQIPDKLFFLSDFAFFHRHGFQHMLCSHFLVVSLKRWSPRKVTQANLRTEQNSAALSWKPQTANVFEANVFNFIEIHQENHGLVLQRLHACE